MNKLRIIAFFCLALLITTQLHAQYQDFTGRYSVELDYKFKKKWKFNFKQECRLNSNSSQFNKSISDFGVEFKHKKWISYGIGGRYIISKTDESIYNKYFGVYFDLKLKYDIGKIELTSRSKAQLKLNYENLNDRVNSDAALLREKITAEYKIKKYKLKPFMSAELFFEDYKDNRKQHPLSFELNAYRLEIGTKYKIAPKHEIEVSYGYEHNLNQILDRQKYMLGISYIYSISKKN